MGFWARFGRGQATGRRALVMAPPAGNGAFADAGETRREGVPVRRGRHLDLRNDAAGALGSRWSSGNVAK